MTSANKPFLLSPLFRKYKASYRGAFFDLAIHVCCTTIGFWLMYSAWHWNRWCSLITLPLVGLLNVKTFIIFHDCGHNSFTPNTALNYLIGIVAGIFVATPFTWNFNHNTHHLTNGNTENKYDFAYNETVLHSFRQYRAMSATKRQMYRFFKHPLVFFTLGPITKFLIIERFRALRLLWKGDAKVSVKNKQLFTVVESIINNVGLSLWFYFLYTHGVFVPFLLANCVGSSCGVMLFHCQHGFNPSYVVDDKTWNKQDNGLLGSSYILVPPLLKYFTGGIEYHHIHHMNAKIPGYNLQYYHEEVVAHSDMFDSVVTLSVRDCMTNLFLVVYDEKKKKFVTFEEADQEIAKTRASVVVGATKKE